MSHDMMNRHAHSKRRETHRIIALDKKYWHPGDYREKRNYLFPKKKIRALISYPVKSYELIQTYTQK